MCVHIVFEEYFVFPFFFILLTCAVILHPFTKIPVLNVLPPFFKCTHDDVQVEQKSYACCKKWFTSILLKHPDKTFLLPGMLSDWFGRKKTYMIFLVPAIACWYISYFVDNVYVWLILRFLHGVFVMVFAVASSVYGVSWNETKPCSYFYRHQWHICTSD